MSWRARLGDDRFRPQGRPPSRPVSRTSVQAGGPAAAAQPRVPRPIAPRARQDGGGRSAAAGPSVQRTAPRTEPNRAAAALAAARATVRRPVSAPSVRSGGGGGQYTTTPTSRPRSVRGPGAGQGTAAVNRSRGPTVRAVPHIRPRSAAAIHRGGRSQTLNTSVAVRNRGGPGKRRTLTAMAVGPQAAPGSPPRPRQVIIPAGSVDEHETTVLDVPPGSPLEQHQRVIIPPGTVQPEETMVVVVPAPRMMQSYDPAAAAAAAAEAEAERRRREHEDRVREAKLAYYEYIKNRTGPEAERLRHMLMYDRPPTLQPYPGYAEREARRAERELWEQDMPDVPDIEVEPPDTQPYRLQMSMNIEEFPPGMVGGGGLTVPTYRGTLSTGSSPGAQSTWSSGPWSPQSLSPPSPPQWNQRFEEAMDEYGADLSDIEMPEPLYGEEVGGWEPAPPPPPLIAPPSEEDPIVLQPSPPRYVYSRPAPHDPEDLLWEWDQPPRPVYDMPILPEPEPYSAELFRLVRL